MTPTQIRNLTSPALIQFAEKKAATERRMTVLVLQLLAEIYQRRAYLEAGYGEFRDFVVKHLKYSDSCATLRIQVMHTLIEFPDIEEKLISGSLSLSVVAQTESTWRQMKKAEATNDKTQDKDKVEPEQTLSFDLTVSLADEVTKPANDKQLGCGSETLVGGEASTAATVLNETKPMILNQQTKADLLKSMDGKSVRDAKKALAELAPKALPKERLQRLTKDHLKLTTAISDNLNHKLGRLKSILSHKYPHLTHAQLLEVLADFALEKWSRDKAPTRNKPKLNHLVNRGAHGKTGSSKVAKQDHLEKAIQQMGENALPKDSTLENKMSQTKTKMTSTLQPVDKKPIRYKRQYISVHIHRQAFSRAEEQCEFVDAKSGRRCESKHQLQTDHIIPLALGGSNELNNLRVLCRQHNALAAVQIFGKKKMKAYWSMDRRG